MSDDSTAQLIAFLRARHAEERQIALNATFEETHPNGNHWKWGEVGNIPAPIARDGYLRGNGGLSPTVSLITVERYPCDGLAFSAPVLCNAMSVYEGVARHIALHDPARVLADLDDKERLVDAYAEVAEMDTDDAEPEFAYGRAVGLGIAVRLLAAQHDDHPDYKEGWAV